MSWGRAAAAVISGAALAVLAPAAATTAAPSPAKELAAAIADERAALAHLAGLRAEAAGRALARSERRLRRVLASPALPKAARPLVAGAVAADRLALRAGPDGDGAWHVTRALQAKEAVLALLGPARQGPECLDGRDNDRDGLVDARFDSGCGRAGDGSERSRLTCRLRYAPGEGLIVLRGLCSGAMARLDVVLPAGAAFDTAAEPDVSHASACRYVGARGLSCLYGDARGNPRHSIVARLPTRAEPPASLRVSLLDVAGRGPAFTVALVPR